MKKIISPFFMPLPACLILALLGLFCLWFTRKQKAGKVLLSISTILLGLLSYGAVSDMPARGRRSEVRGQRSGVRRGRTEDEGLKCGVVGAMGILMTPHRRHVYQLLANEMKIDHWKVSVGYGVLQAVVGIGALLIRGCGTVVLVGYLGAWFVGFWGFGSWVRKRTEFLRTDSRPGEMTAKDI